MFHKLSLGEKYFKITTNKSTNGSGCSALLDYYVIAEKGLTLKSEVQFTDRSIVIWTRCDWTLDTLQSLFEIMYILDIYRISYNRICSGYVPDMFRISTRYVPDMFGKCSRCVPVMYRIM